MHPASMLIDLSVRDDFVNKSVGPMYWGLVSSVVTYGISVVQAHLYYHNSSGDRPWLRRTAATIFLFDTVSTALTIAACYQYFVPNFGNVTNMWQISPPLAAECVFSIQITFIVQMFFVHQIYRVKPSGMGGHLLIHVLVFFAVLAWLFGAVCYVMMFVHENWEHWALGIAIGFSGAKGSAMIFDIISTIAMCVYLKQSSIGVVSGTQKLAQALRVIFFNRGLLVTIVQIFLFVINWAYHTEMFWLTPHLLVTRLYVNTFFAMLNSRQYLRDKYDLNRSEVVIGHNSAFQAASGTNSSRTPYSVHTGSGPTFKASTGLGDSDENLEKFGPTFATTTRTTTQTTSVELRDI